MSSEFKPQMNVLAVGSHPDDIELGCGATLLKHLQRKDNVFVLILTNGNAGNHPPNYLECLNSLKFLGVPEINIFFGHFEDGLLLDNKETVSLIERILIDKKIDRVYTHDFHDRHQDHRNCSKAVSSAGRIIKEIFLYEGPSTETEFEPHYYISFTKKEMKKKIKALESYQSQIKKGIVDLEWVESLAKVNGLRNKAPYAEAFSLNHLTRDGPDV